MWFLFLFFSVCTIIIQVIFMLFCALDKTPQVNNKGGIKTKMQKDEQILPSSE